jgi:hypothetical protein
MYLRVSGFWHFFRICKISLLSTLKGQAKCLGFFSTMQISVRAPRWQKGRHFSQSVRVLKSGIMQIWKTFQNPETLRFNEHFYRLCEVPRFFLSVTVYHFCKIPEVLLFPIPVTICVSQSPTPLIGPLVVENGTTRHFTLSFHSQTWRKTFKAIFRILRTGQF